MWCFSAEGFGVDVDYMDYMDEVSCVTVAAPSSQGRALSIKSTFRWSWKRGLAASSGTLPVESLGETALLFKRIGQSCDLAVQE